MENTYIGRETWGARHDAGAGSRPLPCSEAWLHHTVTKHLSVDASLAAEYAQMRIIEDIGEQRFGRGFSYNLAVFPSGRVYVGCGVRRLGAHTGGRNTKALGVVLAGNYETHAVSSQAQASLVRILRDAKAEGWLTQAKFNGGHRDVATNGTACPGRFAYGLISSLNSRAIKGVGALPPFVDPGVPAIVPAPLPEDLMYRLYQTSDTDRLYAVHPAKVFHIPGMPTYTSMVRLRLFENPGKPLPATQADLDNLVAALA